MRQESTPWWLQGISLCGYEGEGDGGDSNSGGSSGSGTSSDDAGSSGAGNDNDGDDGDEDLPDDKDVAGLKSALQKERADRKAKTRAERALLKELNELKKKQQDIEDKDKSEAEKAKAEAERSKAAVTKLAERFRNQAVDSLIEKVARDLKFKDTDDAISLVKRADIEVEQDENDPAEITVNRKSVEKAVKALADQKKHLIDAEGEGDPSGSKFGGGGNHGQRSKLSEEALKEKYSALR